MGGSLLLPLTDRQIRFELAASNLVIQCAAENIRLVCFRFISTLAEDLEHFKAGRSEIDPRLRPTMHMKRLAKDFAVIKNGEFMWERIPEYERMGEIAELFGLRWGGRWVSLQDIYHVEYMDIKA